MSQDLTRIDDLDRCRQILETHNWDLESAARGQSFGVDEEVLNPTASSSSLSHQLQHHQHHHSAPGPSPSTSGLRHRTRTRTSSSSSSSTGEDEVVGVEAAAGSGSNSRSNNRARDPGGLPIPGSTSVSVWSGLFRVLSFPFNFLLDTIWRIARFAIDLIRTETGAHDPLIEVETFINEFEVRFGSSHPVFHTGSYVQALAQAKRELKFLLIFLHSPADPESEEFCRNVLTHPAVVSYINRNNNLIFWSCSCRSYEGYKVSQALREASHTALIALIVQKEEGLMRLVRRLDVRRISVERFVSQVEQGICENESYIRIAREEREARIMNQEIRRQQDQDYEQSLEVDRRKEREKAEERRKKEEEERVKQEAVDAVVRRKQEMMDLRQRLRDSLPREPDDTGDDEQQVVRVLIKLPDGTRLERRFHRNQSIRQLYQFVYANDAAPLNFQIVSNFPRKVLPCVSPVPENPGLPAGRRGGTVFPGHRCR